jgi:hypothetical protein
MQFFEDTLPIYETFPNEQLPNPLIPWFVDIVNYLLTGQIRAVQRFESRLIGQVGSVNRPSRLITRHLTDKKNFRNFRLRRFRRLGRSVCGRLRFRLTVG